MMVEYFRNHELVTRIILVLVFVLPLLIAVFVKVWYKKEEKTRSDQSKK